MIKKFLTILLFILVAIFWSFYLQHFFKKVNIQTSKNYISDYNMEKFNPYTKILYNMIWADFIYAIDLHTLWNYINGSVSYGKDNWLNQEANYNHIKDFIKYNKDRSWTYELIYNQIIDNWLVLEKTQKKYMNLLKDAIKNIKKEEIKNEDKFLKLYEKFWEIVIKNECPNFDKNTYLRHSKLSSFYSKLLLKEFNNNNFEEALCFNYLSGYNSTLSWWQTLHFGLLNNKLTKEIKTIKKENLEEYVNKKLELWQVYYDLIAELILAKNYNEFNKNSSDYMEIKNLNKSYNLYKNTTKFLYKKYKNNNFK